VRQDCTTSCNARRIFARRRPLALLAALAFSLTATGAAAGYRLERVATGLQRPVFLTAPPGDTERMFIVEQHTGNIRILRLSDRTLLPTPFLTVAGLATANEQGLLGLAFDPDYATNGFFYVYLTDPDTRLLRFQVSSAPDVADPSSATPVLSALQPQLNHNGGWIAFGPDDMLYVALGDGGGADDNDNGHTAGSGNAQDLTDNWFGKILRIDPSGDDFPADAERNYAIPPDNPFVGAVGDDEIWVYGLRNPWRASFDRATGDLYIGDVGQNHCEEIDVQPASSPGGEDYGWRLREGGIATPTGGVGGSAPGAIDPILDYPHADATCSDPGTPVAGIAVTGGYVYRGPIQELVGRYFFADYATARVYSLVWDGSDPAGFDGTNYGGLIDHGSDPRFTPDVGVVDLVSSFGEDDQGNLYVVDLRGDVFLLPEPGTTSLRVGAFAALLALNERRRRRRR
jgi:glucose/arabinose dehydrogenase